MSDRDPSDLTVFRQLEQVVHHLSETLATYRRRALTAEARVKALEAASAPGTPFTEERVRALEADLADARARLRFASERTRLALDRVRFLRQQEETAAVNGNGDR